MFGVSNANARDPRGLYARLGVPPTATHHEIKTAFRRHALTSHPDKGGDKEAFQAIHEAHEVLTDPSQRAAYDNRRCGPYYGYDTFQEFLNSPAGLANRREFEAYHAKNIADFKAFYFQKMGWATTQATSAPSAPTPTAPRPPPHGRWRDDDEDIGDRGHVVRQCPFRC
ncbi:unnamed protein product [Vitrella brassicaformis CCMP3155]|uniref:J domain-containing protein n=1 Tax=Vitrella brassicaformis (strain CCMP3155) TaxID=1169540 RepID=A0A0G4EW74_VITBC|nr:unnamed protein product [Vitrella brassicaformis CCMP3155]|eukprot:CEM02708.1 unnamed protein product [Vitrella brassicaformis CCMP3155]